MFFIIPIANAGASRGVFSIVFSWGSVSIFAFTVPVMISIVQKISVYIFLLIFIYLHIFLYIYNILF